MYENFSDIIKDPHFVNLAAIARRSFRSRKWQERHPEVPFKTLWKHLDAVTPVDGTRWDKAAVMAAITDILTAGFGARSSFRHTEEDLHWLADVLDSKQHVMIISLWKAFSVAPDELMTPAEVAEATGTAESGWRNKAAAGAIPGAIKKGKQWLLPRSVLVAQGVEGL